MACCIIILCIIILIWVCRCNNNGSMLGFVVQSDRDDRDYQVVGSYENYQDAADLLAKLNEANTRIIKHLVDKYRGTRYESDVLRLKSRYNPDVLGEHIPPGVENTSYVMNKGEKIRFCLRSAKDRKTLHGLQIMIFVSMHEISHIINTDTGHGASFWSAFKLMLQNAVEIGIYTPVDYRVHPVNYCNLRVDYSPLYDPNVVASF